MAKSGISLKLDGFEEMLKDIEAAGGTINKAVDSTMKQSAQIVQSELKKQMQGASPKAVDSGLINRMSSSVKWEGNVCTAEEGYKKGSYNPKKLDDGYKAVFINYGTPRIAPPRGFIGKAKKKAKQPVKKAQEQTFKKILERLQK